MKRRDVFRGLAAGLGAPLHMAAAPAATAGIYERIGVRPVINCKGTYTIISGSQTLPEVKRAMDEASRHYVHLDELMDAAGRRLAAVTRAPWGIVTAGCAAALTHATAACVAGADPEKMQRLSDVAGLKSEVIIPRPSRNVYDHAVRMTGVKIVTTDTREDFLAALRPSTAMVMLLGETLSRHPMKLEEMAEAAHRKGVPIIVDAAAERLTIPDVYLAKGADMTAYSGGKCLRGPQCAGLLLGRKNLVQAAWINSAPHHAFGRSMKVGKEEIMGMLAAVEAWVARDHEGEWKQWEAWLATIREAVTRVPGVHTEPLMPQGPSNYAPQLRISWVPPKLGATGLEIADALLEGTPRIVIHAAESSVTVMPYMMMPGDDAIVAKVLSQTLAAPPRRVKPEGAAATEKIAGQWDVEIRFVYGEARHTMYLEEREGGIVGHHRGEFISGDVRGSRRGDEIDLRSSHPYEGTSLGYRFKGAVRTGRMNGTVDLGEYGKAEFTARRRFA
jgi:L-seryl-tRNA(Ser) seleniumtransferase